MRNFVDWITRHPFYSLVGSLVSLLGLGLGLWQLLYTPPDAQLRDLRRLLIDVARASAPVADFAQMSNQEVTEMTGGLAAWDSQTKKRLTRLERAFDTVVGHPGFAKLEAMTRERLSTAGSSFAEYHDRPSGRRQTILRSSCAFMVLAVRAAAETEGALPDACDERPLECAQGLAKYAAENELRRVGCILELGENSARQRRGAAASAPRPGR